MFVHVKVKTKQKKESIVQISEFGYEISVKEEAKHTKANTRIVEILRDQFNTSDIKLVSGHHHPSKLFSVYGNEQSPKSL